MPTGLPVINRILGAGDRLKLVQHPEHVWGWSYVGPGTSRRGDILAMPDPAAAEPFLLLWLRSWGSQMTPLPPRGGYRRRRISRSST